MKYRAFITVWSGFEPQTTFGHEGWILDESYIEKEKASLSSYFKGKVTVEIQIIKRDCSPFE